MFKSLIAIAALVLASPILASECSVDLEGNDRLQFNAKIIEVPASCETFEIKLRHVGKLPREQMGHNVVITRTEDFQAVAQAAMQAGLENEYVVPGDERVLAASKVIGGGEETTLKIDLSGWDRSGEYTFFCSFPGHYAIMNGVFKAGA